MGGRLAPYLVEPHGRDVKALFCFSCRQLAPEGLDFMDLPLDSSCLGGMVISQHRDFVTYIPISLGGKSWEVALQVLCKEGKALVLLCKCCVARLGRAGTCWHCHRFASNDSTKLRWHSLAFPSTHQQQDSMAFGVVCTLGILLLLHSNGNTCNSNKWSWSATEAERRASSSSCFGSSKKAYDGRPEKHVW